MKKIPDDTLKNARPTVEELTQKVRHPVIIVAENIRSLYNVGAIFRTSDGAFIEKLYLCGYTGYPPRKEIDKTALGSVETVPWEHRTDTAEVIKELKERGYFIVVLEHATESVPYNEMDYYFPLCLVVGNEVDGVTDEAVELADGAVEIPMYGLKQSLNVSVAYGISVYHIIGEFHGKGESDQ